MSIYIILEIYNSTLSIMLIYNNIIYTLYIIYNYYMLYKL